MSTIGCENKITVETKKIVHSSNKRMYTVGDDVDFILCRNSKRYNCFGIITDICDEAFTIKSVYIDQMKLEGELDVFYEEIKDGILEACVKGKRIDTIADKNKITVESKKIIHSSDGRKYEIDGSVGFRLCRNCKQYNCFGIITEIWDDVFTIKDVLIDQMKLSDELDIYYEEVQNGILGDFSYDELQAVLGPF